VVNLQEKQLGQARPSDTTATSLYSPAANVTAIIKSIYICNTTASSADFRVFVDDDGTTYDESTALFWDVSLAANTSMELDTFISMNNSSGNIAVRTDTANALTFTAFGAEVS
jgi:hypothetical protein